MSTRDINKEVNKINIITSILIIALLVYSIWIIKIFYYEPSLHESDYYIINSNGVVVPKHNKNRLITNELKEWLFDFPSLLR